MSLIAQASGDRLHWDTGAVARLEALLKTGARSEDWAQIIVDVGSHPRQYVELFHPTGTDIYVVTGGFNVCADWSMQYRKLTGKVPDAFPHIRFPKATNDPHYPVVNGAGEVRLVPGGGSGDPGGSRKSSNVGIPGG